MVSGLIMVPRAWVGPGAVVVHGSVWQVAAPYDMERALAAELAQPDGIGPDWDDLMRRLGARRVDGRTGSRIASGREVEPYVPGLFQLLWMEEQGLEYQQEPERGLGREEMAI